MGFGKSFWLRGAILAASLVLMLQAGRGAFAAGASGVAGVDGNAYRSPNYGYSLSWDDSWQVKTATSANGNDALNLFNGVSAVFLLGSPSDAKSDAACLQQAADDFAHQQGVSDLTRATTSNGKTAAGSDSHGAWAVYEFTYTGSDRTRDRIATYVHCHLLTPERAALEVTQVVKVSDFNSQFAAVQKLLARLALPSPDASRQPANAGVNQNSPLGGSDASPNTSASAQDPTAQTTVPSAPADPATSDCTGMDTWFTATNQRIAQVSQMASQFVSITGTADVTTVLTMLGQDATQFAQMAAAQAEMPVPPAAETANAELVQAFTTYSQLMSDLVSVASVGNAGNASETAIMQQLSNEDAAYAQAVGHARQASQQCRVAA